MFPQQSPISISEPPPPSPKQFNKTPVLMYVLLAVAAIYVMASLFFMFRMYPARDKIAALEQRQQTLETQQAELNKRLHATSSEFKQTLTSQMESTKQEMATRAEELERQQKAAAARLAAAQSQQGKQLAAVSGEVTNVKTDVGSAKTDIQKTQSDLAATNAKLEKTIGDLGVQSGLIAHNAQELDILKRKGERNYYDFTLQKGVRTAVSTISLQLKKVDPKKSKFTLNVIADDRTIEKKDRTVNEPLQFYTGRDHNLYELVVFTAAKNSITGYLSTPKGVPTPVTP